MNPRLAPIFEALGETIAALPDVFSTPQWGGRAYKLPGPGGNRKKPKLLAFVTPADEETGRPALSVSFKLPETRAEAVTERFEWIVRHPRGGLGNHGWVAARVSARRQVTTLKALFKECREQFPRLEPPEIEIEAEAERARSSSGSTSAEARRIERVMREAAAEGWRPGGDEWG